MWLGKRYQGLKKKPKKRSKLQHKAILKKLFSLHFFNPSFRAHEPGRKMLTLPVDTVTILTLEQEEAQLRDLCPHYM